MRDREIRQKTDGQTWSNQQTDRLTYNRFIDRQTASLTDQQTIRRTDRNTERLTRRFTSSKEWRSVTYANDSAAAQTARETNEVEKGGGGARPKYPTFLVAPWTKNIRDIIEFQSPQIACRRHFMERWKARPRASDMAASGRAALLMYFPQ